MSHTRNIYCIQEHDELTREEIINNYHDLLAIQQFHRLRQHSRKRRSFNRKESPTHQLLSRNIFHFFTYAFEDYMELIENEMKFIERFVLYKYAFDLKASLRTEEMCEGGIVTT